MTGNERFDKAANWIESELKQNKSLGNIANSVSQKLGLSTRDLSIVFAFLTGQTLINYIRERKMMAAYEVLLKSPKYDVQEAISLSGLGDQPTFIKSFKKQFGMTPKEAYEKKDFSILKSQTTWEKIESTEIPSVTNHQDLCFNSASSVFGVNRSKYDELKEIFELQEAFDFDEYQSKVAYEIYQTYNLPLKDTFRFVSEYYNYDLIAEMEADGILEEANVMIPPEETGDDMDLLSREEFLKSIKADAADPEIRYVYFKGKMDSIYTVFDVIEKLHRTGEPDVTQLDINVINACANTDYYVGYVKRAVQYYRMIAPIEYEEKASDAHLLEAYLRNVLEYNQPFHEAIDNIWLTDDSDDVIDVEECLYDYNDYYTDEKDEDKDPPDSDKLKKWRQDQLDLEESFEKWAAEQTDYYSMNNHTEPLEKEKDYKDTEIGDLLISADDMQLLHNAGYEPKDLKKMALDELKFAMEEAGVKASWYDLEDYIFEDDDLDDNDLEDEGLDDNDLDDEE